MNRAYTQLLQAKGLGFARSMPRSITSMERSVGQTAPTQPQMAIRQQGFGGHFKDTPPAFVKKKDNKIERKNKPKPKLKKRRKTKKKYT